MGKRADKDYYMIDHDQRFISVHFPGIIDLMEYKPKWNQSNYSTHMSGKYKQDKSWLGPTTRCHDDVVKAALLGDAELYEKYLKKYVSKLRAASGRFSRDYKQKITAVRRRPEFGNNGDELDIHRVYQGQLDKAWRRTSRVEVAQETRLVTLFVQVAGVAYCNATESLWRAAMAILLMEDLIKAGKSVKVVVGGYSTGVTKAKHSMCVSVTVKNYNDKLSVQRLAAMSHLGFYRTFGFGAKSCQPYKLSDGLGYSRDISKKTMPIQFREDVHSGHAKFVVLSRAMSMSDALDGLESAYEQMEDFTK